MKSALSVTAIGAMVLLLIGATVESGATQDSGHHVTAHATHVVSTPSPGFGGYEKALAVVGYGETIQKQAVGEYIFSVEMTDLANYMNAQAAAEAEAAARAVASRAPAYQAPSPSAASSGSGNCASGGGSLDGAPAYVIQRESGGNYCAANPSGACGAYQIMPGTWAGFGGYSSACDAPPAVQDAKAKSMAACNWQPPNYCAG